MDDGTLSGRTGGILGFRAYRSDIGDYMSRWVFEHPLGMVRLHHIRRPDQRVELHDHPFDFISLVLRGWYVEERPCDAARIHARNPGATLWGGRAATVAAWALGPESPFTREFQVRRAPSLAFRRAYDAHRITQVSPGGVWTLVFTGRRKERSWGFWTKNGWVRWNKFMSTKDTP